MVGSWIMDTKSGGVLVLERAQVKFSAKQKAPCQTQESKQPQTGFPTWCTVCDQFDRGFFVETDLPP
jgi:hypothetical protein